MRFNTLINNNKCLEWGLNANQGALFDLINQLSGWATPVIVVDSVYYHISKNKVVEELPLFYSKSDTVYRHFRILEDKGLINYLKQGKMDLICVTEKGKEWNSTVVDNSVDNFTKNSEMNPNSEIDPSKFGNESEKNSDLNPTYNNTSINNKTNNKKKTTFLSMDDFVSDDFKDIWLTWIKYKKEIKKPYKTENGERKAFSELKKLSNNNVDVASSIIQQSIDKEWQGLFELKDKSIIQKIEIKKSDDKAPAINEIAKKYFKPEHVDRYGYKGLKSWSLGGVFADIGLTQGDTYQLIKQLDAELKEKNLI